MEASGTDVFVYGTLTDPERVARVIESFEFREDAILDGLHRVTGEFPTLAPGGTVSGRILWSSEVERLDSYEGVESGLYVRVSVPRATQNRASEAGESVAVYVGDPDALGADAEWPGTGTFPERVRRFCRENGVTVRQRSPGNGQ